MGDYTDIPRTSALLDDDLRGQIRGVFGKLTEELEMCIPDTRGEQELEDREMGRILNAFLETLPRESRQIFLRRYWHADSIAQIAARYGMTQSKIKMQLSRTRAKLCTYLEQEGVKV